MTNPWDASLKMLEQEERLARRCVDDYYEDGLHREEINNWVKEWAYDTNIYVTSKFPEAKDSICYYLKVAVSRLTGEQ